MYCIRQKEEKDRLLYQMNHVYVFEQGLKLFR